jgi:chromosome segregation ATPase
MATTDTQPVAEPSGPEPSGPEPAARPSAAAAREATEWSARRVQMQARISAIGGELDQAAAALAETRRRAVLGDDLDDAIAELEHRRRALEAERSEAEQRIAIALAEEADATQRANEAYAIERQEDELAEAWGLVEVAIALDAQVSAAAVALRSALRERLAIATRANQLMAGGVRVDGLEAARQPVARDGYLERLPAFADPADRIGFQIPI